MMVVRKLAFKTQQIVKTHIKLKKILINIILAEKDMIMYMFFWKHSWIPIHKIIYLQGICEITLNKNTERKFFF